MGTKNNPSWLFEYTAEELDEWWERAACRDHPLASDWFEDGAKGKEARERAVSTCRMCPVARECLDYAMRHPELEGIWGGSTQTERRKARAGVSPTQERVEGMCRAGMHSLDEHGRQKWRIKNGKRVKAGRSCRACDRQAVRDRRASGTRVSAA